MKYLVKLTLHIGEYEKGTSQIIDADTEEAAIESALRGECHNDPDFSEFPDGDGCWDGGEFVYKLYSVVELTDMEYEILDKLNMIPILGSRDNLKERVVIAFGEEMTSEIANGGMDVEGKGVFVIREFQTNAEANAYKEALNDVSGWHDSYVLDMDEEKKYSNEINK